MENIIFFYFVVFIFIKNFFAAFFPDFYFVLNHFSISYIILFLQFYVKIYLFCNYFIHTRQIKCISFKHKLFNKALHKKYKIGKLYKCSIRSTMLYSSIALDTTSLKYILLSEYIFALNYISLKNLYKTPK